MSDNYQAFLLKLNDNLNTLREREARHAGNAPLDLLNQIAGHQKAIALTGTNWPGKMPVGFETQRGWQK